MDKGNGEVRNKIAGKLISSCKWLFARPKLYIPILLIVLLLAFLWLASSPSILLFYISKPPGSIEAPVTKFYTENPDEQFYASIRSLIEENRLLWQAHKISSYEYTYTWWGLPDGSSTTRVTVRDGVVTAIVTYERYVGEIYVRHRWDGPYDEGDASEWLFDYILVCLSDEGNFFKLAFHPEFHIPVYADCGNTRVMDGFGGFFLSSFKVLK
jgi:hypothetical protein